MNAQPSAFLPTHPKASDSYKTLRSVDVSPKVERKNGLAYLSWAFAVDELLQRDPDASWEYAEPKPFGQTLMVFCAVTAFGRTRTAQLPVMDHRNRAIENPDAFAVNTAMQRCLVKAIALHGLGLYIYAGEDLPGTAAQEASVSAITVNPRGDLGKDEDPKVYMDLADRMRAALVDPDDDQDRICAKVLDMHDELRIQHDRYVGASDCLSAKERAVWKKYVKMAQDKERAELPVMR